MSQDGAGWPSSVARTAGAQKGGAGRRRALIKHVRIRVLCDPEQEPPRPRRGRRGEAGLRPRLVGGKGEDARAPSGLSAESLP